MQSQIKKQKKQNPSWQDLNPFLLSKIFASLSLHDQLFGPPYVCHSWLSATLHTLFQNSNLDLRLIDTLDEENQRLRFTQLLKLAINQYHGWASIYFPTKHTFGYFATLYIAERTPNISCVVLSCELACVDIMPVFVSMLYWKNLRVFRARIHPAGASFPVISQLVDHCKNITELRLHGTLTEKEVSCMVEGFPRLERLDLSESILSGDALGIVLDGRLKRLKELNLLHCSFLDENGEDIREENYVKLKEFRNEMLEKVSGLKSLKKFKHCLMETCHHCEDSTLDQDK